MATRNLTEVFMLLRHNAIQSRHVFVESNYDDRTALVSSDVESGSVSLHRQKPSLPPEWVDSVEEIQRQIPRIKKQMTELSSLHTRHLNRPTLDDNKEEEEKIEEITSKITQMFHSCQAQTQRISNKMSKSAGSQNNKLAKNVILSLARELQDLSGQFRKSQTDYLDRMKGREARAAQLFNNTHELDSHGFEEIDLYDRSFAREHVQAVKENTATVEQREKEIKNIAQSIVDLNVIFKDLATMIADQGTILDRIDYNIEQTSIHVEEGHAQLVKAEKFQKKNRKMIVILILTGIVIILIIILLVKSFH